MGRIIQKARSIFGLIISFKLLYARVTVPDSTLFSFFLNTTATVFFLTPLPPSQPLPDPCFLFSYICHRIHSFSLVYLTLLVVENGLQKIKWDSEQYGGTTQNYT